MSRSGDARMRDDLSLAGVLSRTAVAETLSRRRWRPSPGPRPVSSRQRPRTSSREEARAHWSWTRRPTSSPTASRPARRARAPCCPRQRRDLHGLVADEQLSDLVIGDARAEHGSRLAEQRFLAETAIIAVQAPSLSRTLVIAPERRGDLD